MKIKGLLKLTFSRLFAVALSVILQVALMVFFMIKLTESYVYFQIGSTILAVLILVGIANESTHPEQKILWVLLISVVPIVGIVLYMTFSFNKPRKKSIEKYTKFNKEDLNKEHALLLTDKYEKDFKYLENQTGIKTCKNTNCLYLKDGSEFYDSLIKDLKNAKKFIFMEYFIINHGLMWDSILQILIQKAKEGLDIRLIYDDLGCCKYVKGNYYKKLRKLGIKCYKFNKMIPLVSSIHNNRDHRKITIIDGTIGYTGGINISDEYMNINSPYGYWKDNAIRLTGEGVDNLTILFLQIYSLVSKTTNDIKPFLYKNNCESKIFSDEIVYSFGSGPKSFYYDNTAINVFLNLINSANKSIDISTPYLITDYSITNALISASKKGVKVRILFPSRPDKKLVWLFGKLTALELLKNGVEIYSYTPGFNHAKSFLVDDKIAFVGTTNLDFRSLLHHLECGTLIYNSECLKNIDENFENDYLLSKKLEEKDLKMNPLSKVIVSFLRIFQTLL